MLNRSAAAYHQRFVLLTGDPLIPRLMMYQDRQVGMATPQSPPSRTLLRLPPLPSNCPVIMSSWMESKPWANPSNQLPPGHQQQHLAASVMVCTTNNRRLRTIPTKAPVPTPPTITLVPLIIILRRHMVTTATQTQPQTPREGTSTRSTQQRKETLSSTHGTTRSSSGRLSNKNTL